MRPSSKTYLAALTVALMLATPVAASADDPSALGFVGYYIGYTKASNARTNTSTLFNDSLICYDADTGALLDCPITYTLLGVATDSLLTGAGFNPIGMDSSFINGGHTHTNNRPLFFTSGVSSALLMIGGHQTGGTALSVVGSTANQQVDIAYSVPEQGGVIAATVTFSPPHGYFCFYYCYTRQETLDIAEIAIGFFQPGTHNTQFVQVPQSGDDYLVVAGAAGHSLTSSSYTYGSYLRSDTRDTLLKIAAVYHTLSGNQLSINDMSLPVGGNFDYTGNWGVPHNGHREGKAADINSTDGGGVDTDCYTDLYLQQAVKKVLGPNQAGWTKFLCEAQGQKHINILPAF